jgi:integrase
MGYIRKTPAGTYQADWRDPAGRKKSKTFPTKKAAAAFLAETESTVNRGTYVDPHAGRIKFAAHAERWSRSHEVSARSAERIASVLRSHLIPRWGEWPLSAIEHMTVQEWTGELGKRLSPATVRKVFGVMSQVMASAVRARLISGNPCDGVRIGGSSNSAMLTISRDDFLGRLLPAVPAEHRAMVATAGGTGLRWGELAGLPWGAVDLETGSVRVQQVAVETSGSVVIKPSPKTRAGVRTVPLPRFVSERLKAMHAELESAPTASALVFDTRTGTALRRSNFRRQVWRPALVRAGLLGRIVVQDERRLIACWLDDAGIERSAEFTTEREAVAHVAEKAAGGLRFHDLRHSYATWLVSDNMPVNVVQRIMGHQKATTTLNLYTHAPTDYDQRVRDAFGGHAEFLPSNGVSGPETTKVTPSEDERDLPGSEWSLGESNS